MKSKIHEYKKKRLLVSKLNLLLFLLSCFLIPNVHSQNAVVASGGDATGTGGKVSYSVGQIAYTYASGTNGSVNQGVQQPFEISTLGNDNFPNIVLEMSVYPNPTANNVTLKISDFSTENLSYQLFDIAGKQILSEQVANSVTEINMDNLNSAIYFLIINNQNKIIKTFKIIKN
ncbi:MAG: T9SS type A sorting domain-containing protein [Flavobacterium sp.]|uniref:T9SS type A sorting domain-containing protein n=1 Tax=Flavobacterium sp. TaxID=239 RepID=UPI0022C47020|nr:T9SS type A sorting domain-containing protein [Flavobacterium sp.]MCZ8196416.1 T9SS type A sorting domain-containing protein [Flavobacterium sp.]